jgi:septum formation protein
MKRLPLILASASPRRADLLGAAGLEFQIIASAAPEVAPEHLTPAEVAMINACRKARAVAKHHPDALVIGADTVVALGTRLFAKPATMDDARAMLAELQGKIHEVVTGMCLIHLRGQRTRAFSVSTLVKFRALDEAQIRRYLAAIEPLDKAGGYAIQDRGEWIVEELRGSLSNVVGLPLDRLLAELELWKEPAP